MQGRQVCDEENVVTIDLQAVIPSGIVKLRVTKCEMVQYQGFERIMTAIYCGHVRL